MTAACVQFLISAVIIVAAGTLLTRCADLIAERTGWGRLLVGSILLAGATSLPELTVDISAVRAGWPDLAAGDLLGSSLFNLMILAVLDLTTAPKGRMLSRVASGHALSGNFSAALTMLVGLCLMSRTVSAHGELLGISYGLWLVMLGYLLGVRLVYYDQKASAALTQTAIEHRAEGGLFKPAAGFCLAAVVIIVVGPYLSDAAGRIAELSGLGKTFVGTTLVACSTSLPELVASLVALRMGAIDLAVGNVFGSNAFNMILLAPLDLVHRGPLLGEIGSGHVVTCQAAVLATLVVVIGQLYQVEQRWRFIEPDATLVLAILLGTLWLVYRLG